MKNADSNHSFDINSESDISFVKNKSIAEVVMALREDGRLIRHIEDQTPFFCRTAVFSDARAIAFIRNQTPELCTLSVKVHPESLRYIKNKTLDLCSLALRSSDKKETLLPFIPQEFHQDLKHLIEKFDIGPSISADSLNNEEFLSALKDRSFDDKGLKYLGQPITKENAHEYLMNPTYCLYALQALENPTEDEILQAVMCEPEIFKCLRDDQKTEKVSLAAVRQDAENLKYVTHQTESICSAAIQSDPDMLYFVKEQTEDLCTTAVMHRPELLQYVREQTERLCLIAVSRSGSALRYVLNPTAKIELEAVKNDPSAIRFVSNPTKKMLEIVQAKCPNEFLSLVPFSSLTEEELEYCVRNHEKALSYIPNQTEYLCTLAVDAFPDALQYVRGQTRMICLTAVRNSGNALRFVRDQTEEICYAAVERDGEAIQYVRGKKSTDLCLAAVWENPDALGYVEIQTDEIIRTALDNDGMALQYIDNPTEEDCIRALENDLDAEEFIPLKTPKILAAIKRIQREIDEEDSDS